MRTRGIRPGKARSLFLAAVLCGAWAMAGCDSSSGERVRFETPVENPQAAAKAFRLFYLERVERAVLAYNRFCLFGDSVFATTIGSRAIAREGDDYEIVPGPTDNNLIGTSTYAVASAYRIFRSRPLALTLIRMFEGLVFFEAVPGIPGLTSREVFPGWTRVMDGRAATTTRTRDGKPVAHPMPPAPSLEAEVLRTFYDGVRITYREDPGEFMFRYKPVAELEDYAITYSIDERPRFIRSSDCCSSLMRTPEGHPWEGAYWGNHNSRDNLPDLMLGFLAALQIAGDPEAEADVREAAARALEAGRRVSDLIGASGENIMTVDEYHRYGDLTVSGARRPHGDPENQDLGSLAACPMEYLAQTVSTAGLALPFEKLPEPGSIEELILRTLFGLEVKLPPVFCTDLNQAYFGATWATVLRTPPLLGLAGLLDRLDPGLADSLIGSFQNDYDDIVESTVGVVHYARATGREDLEQVARASLLDQTNLMRDFADVIYTRIDPARRAEQRYEAAVFDTLGGLDPIAEDFDNFQIAERRMAEAEALLEIPETASKVLLTDEEIRGRIEGALAREDREPIVRRYRDAYGSTPPVRRAGDGYEARTSRDQTWRPVENPHHRGYGGPELLQEIPICVEAPHVLDCTWAKIGCAAADLDGSGFVDETDRKLFQKAFTEFEPLPPGGCKPSNGWCGGADLDRTGDLDSLDRVFVDAADGCKTGI